MDITFVITVTALALVSLADNRFYAAASQSDVNTTDVPQANRTSKELQEKSKMALEDPATELKTTGRKWTSNDYNTFSSLTSDIVVETSSSTASPKSYPSLTTSVPTFVTRGRYIRNPFYFSKEDQEVEFEDDQHGDVMVNNGVPRWNRYNNNHRQLNKYGPTPIEADITVDEDGSTGYGSTFDFGGDSGNAYRSPNGGWSGGAGGGGDSMMGWYSEPVPQSSRPVPIIAEIRHPASHKMSIDVTKIGMLALVKIALAKLKALGFIKAMLLVVFKLKLLIIAVIIKSLLLMKFMKVALIPLLLPALLTLLSPLMFPFFFSRFSRLFSLINQPVLVPNTTPSAGNGETTNRRSSLDLVDVMDPSLASFRLIMQSEKCVARIACRMAGAKKPSLSFVWMNWLISPLSKYIPNEKIRSYISTFTEVTDYRLDNMYSNVLPDDWTKWCTDHYDCDEATNKLETFEQ